MLKKIFRVVFYVPRKVCFVLEFSMGWLGRKMGFLTKYLE